MKKLIVLLTLFCSAFLHAAPSRIITLSWEATEYVLTLGITPLAMADRNDYQKWVISPQLPSTVLDAGSRLEPNLERIYALKPDLIIINPALAGMQENLARIAPTLLLDAFKIEHDNLIAAEQLQRQLAIQLGRLPEHTTFLKAQQDQINLLKSKLIQRYGSALPAVCVVRFASPTTFWAYGENSMPEAAMKSLGLKNACPQPRTAWGTRLQKIPDLATLNEGWLLHIAPFPKKAELERSPLWQALPVVQQNRVRSLPPVWTNGGLYSLTNLASIISTTLLKGE